MRGDCAKTHLSNPPSGRRVDYTEDGSLAQRTAFRWRAWGMIVEPGFFYHWKTRLLVQITADPSAPMMVLKLWAYCQTRRKWEFSDLDDDTLSIICECSGKIEELKPILTRCKFVHQVDDTLVVNDWQFYNRTLINSWNNGLKGGRPKRYKTKPMGSSGLLLKQPTLSKSKSTCTVQESTEYCTQVGLKQEDGEWFFDKCEGCGWKNNGKPIVDWKATIRAWRRIEIFPSQKNDSQPEYKKVLKEPPPRGAAYRVFDPDGPPE